MSQSLEKLAGGKLETTLRKMTSNPFKSLGLGAGVTVAVQSSSAVPVMLVGLVNSGIMTLDQTVGVIMGSNIGTTLTAWILSMAGIESDNIFISILKPENFSPLVAFIGIILFMLSKKKKSQDIGMIMLGFSVLMFGMELMKNAVAPLADIPEFQKLLIAFSVPIVGVLFGAIFTGIIQSSAASVGILQALSMTGTISYRMAIPIIMGQNIGTCVTALISSIGVNRNAKRVTVVHMSFNIIGTVVCMLVFYSLDTLMHFAFLDNAINPLEIAFVHSIFNIITTIILLPLSNLLVKLAYKIIPDSKNSKTEDKTVWLDERLLASPPLAVSQCKQKAKGMAKLSKAALHDALGIMLKYDKITADSVEAAEQKIDIMEDKLATYMLKLSQKELTEADSNTITELLHTIGDFERISDHAINIVNISQEINESGLEFSDEAKADFTTLFAALTEISELSVNAFNKNDLALAYKVEPLEEVIDNLTSKIKRKHIERMQKGSCNPELGVHISNLLIYIERISDHYSNIAVVIIQTAHANVFKHDYLNELRTERSPQFIESYNAYKHKYRLAEL